MRDIIQVHAYLESVLRLCLLFLEGFRGNELGMMRVVSRGDCCKQGGCTDVKVGTGGETKKQNKTKDMT